MPTPEHEAIRRQLEDDKAAILEARATLDRIDAVLERIEQREHEHVTRRPRVRPVRMYLVD